MLSRVRLVESIQEFRTGPQKKRRGAAIRWSGRLVHKATTFYNICTAIWTTSFTEYLEPPFDIGLSLFKYGAGAWKVAILGLVFQGVASFVLLYCKDLKTASIFSGLSSISFFSSLALWIFGSVHTFSVPLSGTEAKFEFRQSYSFYLTIASTACITLNTIVGATLSRSHVLKRGVTNQVKPLWEIGLMWTWTNCSFYGNKWQKESISVSRE